MPVCRVLLDAPGDGAWNMAVDEILLARAAAEGRCHLRIYGWAAATVSLGYFQKAADRQSHPQSRDCPLVRRASGGGAIIHDREITYALAVPRPRSAREQRQLYRRMHEALAELLGRLGAPASLCQSAEPKQTTSSPFLCFQRRTEGDVLIGGSKVIGSAQRREKQAVLQHGSILLQTSALAPELAGIEELSRVQLPRKEWVSLVLNAALTAFNLQPRYEPLNESDCHAAARLAEERFGRPEWNAAR